MNADTRAEFMRLTDILTPWAIRVAATLRIADLIAEGHTTVADLAAKSDANADALARLMRYLVARGVFSEPQPDAYGLTDLGAPLLSAHPGSRRTRLDLEGMGGRIDSANAGLLQAVRTGRPSYADMFGLPFWADIVANPDMEPSFDEVMADHTPWFGEVVAGHSWEGVKHVVDVGGGTGALLAAILHASPDIHGVLVDQTATVAEGQRYLAAQGLADRATAVVGDFFEALPSGADVYVLSNILHDWSDEDAVRILRRCADAAGAGGRILIADRVVDQNGDEAMLTMLDLRMLVLLGGRERDRAHWLDVISTAGLTVRSTVHRDGGVTLLECVPATVRETADLVRQGGRAQGGRAQ
ncbi:hypothetical protein ALI144C_37770 [Actinosynnema sp. ALI-1.44]|uniref:methyltransferase n=1 Tax=Actinosynnema sp. ALI-1.44 TaxID=1933779 RepID=UPI00097C9C18|nr:methyltransferase [Actinosynnema sp. ALI-1.44]ONI76391.1 hypothetical protein ALI144C_37770 [Actinosynnema sp. ALI-1.44]